jgi:bifunctional non-homologous end joining protein LigD
MLATSGSALPIGPEWTYEVKWDGYRALATKDGARVRLVSRNQKDLMRNYPTVVAVLQTVRVPKLVVDGELVALDAEDRPSFQALQHRMTSGLSIVYYAFDVLAVGAESLVRQPRRAPGWSSSSWAHESCCQSRCPARRNELNAKSDNWASKA